MWVGLLLGLGGARGAQGVNGKWVADATPVDATRTGFATDTVLPEFGALAAPERVDPISTSLDLTEAGGAVIGIYSDAQGVTCTVNGTFNPVTGAVALTGTCGDWDVSATLTYAGGALAGTLTVARDSGGASSENRTWSATRGAVVALSGTHYYVDSRAGSALNDGLSAAAPLDSTATVTLAEGDTLWLARGTRLREMVYSVENGVSCRAYGVGPRPILEGSVLAGTWSKTGGYTNVWELSYTPSYDDAAAGSTYVPLLNGVAMKRIGRTTSALATDLTALDADPDACVAPQSDGSGTYTIHIYAASDPNASGDVYEIPSRENCVRLTGDGPVVWSLHGRACAGDNGPIRPQATGALAHDCVASWGPLHNIVYSSGSSIEHCVSLFSPVRWEAGSIYYGNNVVGYVSAGLGTATAAVTDCAVIQYPRVDLEGTCDAFLTHTAGVSPWGSVAYDQIYVRGARSVVDGINLDHTAATTVDRAYCEQLVGSRPFTSLGLSGAITRSRVYGHVAGYLITLPVIDQDTAASSLYVDRCLITVGSVVPNNLITGLATIETNKTTVRCYTASSRGIGSYGADVSVVGASHNVLYNATINTSAATGDGVVAGASNHNQANPSPQYWRRNSATTARVFGTTWQSTHADLDQQFSVDAPTWSDATGDRPLCNAKTDGYNTGHGTFTRALTFAAAGYTPAVAGDLGGLVTGGTTGDTGILESYDNDAREWVVVPLTTGDTFASTEAVTIVEAWSGQGAGTGAGTTTGASALVPGFEFDFETDQPTGYAWANFVDAITP